MHTQKTLTNRLGKLTNVLVISLAVFACQSETSAQNAETIESKAEAVEAKMGAKVESIASKAEKADTKAIALDESTYTVLSAPLEVSTGDKIEVMELFWFGCGHCYSLEPAVKSWLENKPDNAEFVKMPAVFSKRWEIHAQAYYMMQELGVEDKAVDDFFHQIHVTGKQVRDLDGLVTFFSRYGKSEQEVKDAYNSFGVDTKLRNAKILTAKSTARGVPAILVDGKYITSVTAAGGDSELFNVVNQLVEKAASER